MRHSGTATSSSDPPPTAAPARPETFWTARMQTSDLTQARAFARAHLGVGALRPLHPSATPAADLRIMRLGPITVADLQYGADMVVGCEPAEAFQVLTVLSGRLAGRQDGRPLVATPRRMALADPLVGIVVDRWSADCRLAVVTVAPGLIEEALRKLLGSPLPAPVHFASGFDATTGSGLVWRQIVEFLVDVFDNPTALGLHPGTAEQLCTTVIGCLVSVADPRYEAANSHSAHLPGRDPIRRVVDAIHADAGATFSTRSLAEIAGVSARALQAGFQQYLGVGPMTYLRQVRLVRVHQELLAAGRAGQTVADIAKRWGFGHAGRFAETYKNRYGHSPSETLRG